MAKIKSGTNAGNKDLFPPEQVPQSVEQGFLIVGIGASAGGLESFISFFQNIPPNTGMAFVVVQHLDPTHKSLLSDLLRNYTKMTVLEAVDNTRILPNTIYTIPPNKELAIFNGVLQVLEPTEARGFRRTIDHFMRSLAKDQQEKAVGIILSGTGTEGAAGLKAIKGEGGLTLVQDPESAKYDGMPRNAIAAQAADYILPPADMPKHLIRYAEKRVFRPVLAPAETWPQQHILDKIFLLLREHTGNNFSLYKTNTILRRINKRMAINQISQLEAYLKYLQEVPEEADLLFDDLLIGVTSFFRDKEAFQALEATIVPNILNNKANGDPIRIWVAGCSTGEEAYSIAILFDEALNRQKKRLQLQIFATDIDASAIKTARAGIYPESIGLDLGEQRLKRYFIANNHELKIKKELRDKVIFAEQNLVSDSPFSRIDLISCRNLLIYLNADAQKRVFPIFHYSLNPKGILFLGTSETIGQFSHLFHPLDRKHKLFLRKAGIFRYSYPSDFPSTGIPHTAAPDRKLNLEPKHPAMKLSALTEKMLLVNYAPDCVLINDKNTALYFYGNTGKYLQPTPGEASFDILEMARMGLKADLRSAINKARKTKKEEQRKGVKVLSEGGRHTITLKVKPIENQPGLDDQLLLVIFEEASPQTELPVPEVKKSGEAEPSQLAELEYELTFTKEYLRTTVEELEISNEEMKSANEELQSANEELQSTNEELETSKEELQSVNEELNTVNTELQNMIDELAHAQDDMSNLLASTDIGTVFLSKNLEIRRFTPSINKIMPLIQADIGRPVSHLASNLLYDQLAKDAQEVLDNLRVKKNVVETKDGKWYQMQIVPYRTTNNLIDGVALTFVDITDGKLMEEELKKLNEHLNLTMETLAVVPFTFRANENFDLIFVGESATKVLGFKPDNFTAIPDFWASRIHSDDKDKLIEDLKGVFSKGYSIHEFRWKCSDGDFKHLTGHIRLMQSPLKSTEKYILGIWRERN